MKTILNILWLLLSGLWMALGYVAFGIIACVTIIGIPFGIASFRIANYALWPFGRTVVRRPDAGGFSALGNVVWVLVAGLWLAIGHLASGFLLCITIIGIPFGIANFKMIPVSLLPLGRQIVRIGQPYGREYTAGSAPALPPYPPPSYQSPSYPPRPYQPPDGR